MTKDEIMALEGRELDAAVARHVMGRNVVNIDPVDGEIGYFVEREGEWVKTRGKAFPKLDELPNYSTDIAEAWQVVEYLSAWKFEIDRREYSPGDVEFKVGVCLRSDNDPTKWREMAIGFAPTAPLAICRAALLAVLSYACPRCDHALPDDYQCDKCRESCFMCCVCGMYEDEEAYQ